MTSLVLLIVILAHLELIIDFDNEFHCLSLPQGCVYVGILEAGGQCHGMYIPGKIDLVCVWCHKWCHKINPYSISNPSAPSLVISDNLI